MKQKKVYCSFCGKEIKSYVLSGIGACICPECVHLASKYIDELKCEPNNKIDITDVPKPKEIKAFLDQYIIGQDRAKERVSVAVYNHYKRIYAPITDDVEIEKSNLLLLGKTGTGKTMIARTIAKMLNVPFAISDATTLTEAGYVGDDVESVIGKLYQAADYDIEKTERGIVFIDEIDKIARKSDNPSITRDVSGEGVQQGLLKLLEDSIVSIPPRGGRKHPEQPLVQINTKNILFICGGAFVGIEKKIKARCNKQVIGFNSSTDSTMDDKDYMEKLTANDLKSYGLIPEILGRLPIITYTDELDKNALLRILKEPKNALVKQYKKIFELDGVKLDFTEDALDYIVEKTLENNLGARGLRGTMENVMNTAMFETPSSDIHKLTIDIDYVKSKLG